MASSDSIRTTCCITGGGPAGMMLGYLLARAGIDVTVIEKHADFLRDFRGDTIHPSTLELMHELGLLDEFLALPHDRVEKLGIEIGPDWIDLADFTHLPTHEKYIAFMPQWDFLDFLADKAKQFETFHLYQSTEVTGLIEEDGNVIGVCANRGDGKVEFHADLVVACDGRHSTLRENAGLTVNNLGAPMDVLWFRLSKTDGDPEAALGHVAAGHMMITLNRTTYWQCAYLIAKGDFDETREDGLDQLRRDIAATCAFLSNRVDELESWDQVKLLTVRVDRLDTWHKPGLLLIGDAAHAMSPIGGVGINLAIQDAVAAANLLALPLAKGVVTQNDLAAVQNRRLFAARMTQSAQIFIQNRLINPILSSSKPVRAPLILRWLGKIPFLHRIPAYLVGIGVRPEHIKTERYKET